MVQHGNYVRNSIRFTLREHLALVLKELKPRAHCCGATSRPLHQPVKVEHFHECSATVLLDVEAD